MLKRIKNWLWPKQIEICTVVHEPNKTTVTMKGQKPIVQYFCDVCKQKAQHIAIVPSDTGNHVIGSKCDEHIGMVIRRFTSEGTNMDPNNRIHFAGFKAQPYSKWFECECPENTTHFILGNDPRLQGDA